MSSKNFNVEMIEKVFKEKKIKFPINEFIEALTNEDKKIKAEKKAKQDEESSKIHIENVFPALKGKTTIEEFIDELVEKEEWYDHFYIDDDGGMDDDGEDDTIFYMVGDKVYEVDIHCEADWVGDWSVRANLPGEVSVTSIKEIKNFEIIEKKKHSVIIKRK